jgi:acylphosphatase
MAQEAQRLRLSGWVRNRLDGSVKALVSGAPETVQVLIDWAKGGPALARVDSAMVTEPNEERVATGFELRET